MRRAGTVLRHDWGMAGPVLFALCLVSVWLLLRMVRDHGPDDPS